jgi:hypothetical protein
MKLHVALSVNYHICNQEVWLAAVFTWQYLEEHTKAIF